MKNYEMPEVFELADATEATLASPVSNPADNCGACLEDPCGGGAIDA